MPISLSVKEASRESGLSVRTLWRLIGEGKLKSTTVRKRRLITMKALTDLVTRGVPSSGADLAPAGGAKKKRTAR